MMNVDNDDVEQLTTFQLAPASHQCIPTGLSNSGAGVNAASGVDLTFVASNPLSELVWSPHNGLCLKCAECSFTKKKHSLLWDVSGLNNMVLSPTQAITAGETAGDKPMDEGNLIISPMTFRAEGGVGEEAALFRSPRSISGVKPVCGSSHGCDAGASDNMEEISSSVLHTEQKVENTSMTDGKGQCSQKNIQMNSTAETRENNADMTFDRNVESPEDRETQKTDFLPLRADEPRNDMAEIEPFSAEDNKVIMFDRSGRNEDLSLGIEEQGKSAMKIDGFAGELPLEKLEFSAENDLQLSLLKDLCGKSEERFNRDKSVRSAASPTTSRTCMDRRKRKAMALSDGDVKEIMSKGEDNSHESAESCNSAGRIGLFSTGNEEQLTVGNKRANMHIQSQGGLGSTSFIRQGSSFMNWISNMVKGLNKTNHDEGPSLALTLGHGHENRNQELVTYSRNNDPGSVNMGFQTMFQNMYGSKQGTRMSDSPKTLSAAPEICKTSSCSDQNRTSFNLACSSMKDGRNSLTSSLGKHKADGNENDDYGTPAEGKVINNAGYKCDPLRSFWITRFSPKSFGPALNLDHGNQNRIEALKYSTDCAKLIPCTSNLVDRKSSEANENSTEVLVDVTGKELQKLAPKTEASSDFRTIHGGNDQKSGCKLNPILLSPKLKNSEVLASMFARRLDALKHIIPPDVEHDTTHKMTTCFYCGRSGHDLRNCSEITETEKENYIINASLYDGSKESPCFCIRCFQLDHWAISCPMASITTQSHFRVPDVHANCDGKNFGADIGKHVGSSSRDNVLKEKLITPLCDLVKRNFSDVPRGIFDAIRKLRLSRMDILEWMNSHTSLLHLDGFFLRLRLGRWEEGLGGTGYYVARITGMSRSFQPHLCTCCQKLNSARPGNKERNHHEVQENPSL